MNVQKRMKRLQRTPSVRCSDTYRWDHGPQELKRLKVQDKISNFTRLGFLLGCSSVLVQRTDNLLLETAVPQRSSCIWVHDTASPICPVAAPDKGLTLETVHRKTGAQNRKQMGGLRSKYTSKESGWQKGEKNKTNLLNNGEKDRNKCRDGWGNIQFGDSSYIITVKLQKIKGRKEKCTVLKKCLI